MKTFYLTLVIAFLQSSLFAQCCPYMDNFDISPEIPCSNIETQLLTTVTTPNLGEYFGYEIQQTDNFFSITACYAQGFSTALETYNEIVDFGILPAGEYEYEYIALLSEEFDAEQCPLTAFTQNEVVGNFTVITCNNPDDVTAEFLVNSISCFGANDGSIQIAATGGVPPYQYSIDGTTFQSSPDFLNLEPGEYIVTIMDAVGSFVFPNHNIEEATEYFLDVGPDIIWEPNTTFTIAATTNMPSDNINWSPPIGLSCSICFSAEAIPPNPMCYTFAAVDFNGCLISDEICFVAPNDVHEIESISFELFPNPVSDFLTIEFNETITDNFEIQVLNIKSQQIFGQKFSSSNKNHQINVSDLPNGVYLIQIISNSLIYSQKFIKI